MTSGTSTLHNIALTLVAIGAINWGLIGFFDFNLVSAILGGLPALERIVYALVGVAAIVMLATEGKRARHETSDRRDREVPAM